MAKAKCSRLWIGVELDLGTNTSWGWMQSAYYVDYQKKIAYRGESSEKSSITAIQGRKMISIGAWNIEINEDRRKNFVFYYFIIKMFKKSSYKIQNVQSNLMRKTYKLFLFIIFYTNLSKNLNENKVLTVKRVHCSSSTPRLLISRVVILHQWAR